MPDSLPPDPMRLPPRRTPFAAAHRPPPAGLPILSTEPLTGNERKTLAGLAQAHRLLAEAMDEALRTDRVDGALFVMAQAAEVAELDATLAVRLGSNR
jgi:hypothetical protein